jgi:hypothetical protein
MRSSSRRYASLALAVPLVATILAAQARIARAELGDCGQPLSNGSGPVTTDCLYILNVAIGLQSCSPDCICAPNGVLPTAADDALACLIAATGATSVLDCPCGASTTLAPPTTTTVPASTSTTTTTLVLGAACPDTLEVTAFAHTGPACGGDEDCPVGSCDLTLARCASSTDFDFGWTGVGHDMDTNDAQRLVTRLTCGDVAPCGACAIDGIDPASHACRCANDNRKFCDAPFAVDQDDCGGDVCNCYLGPPLPLAAGSTPACILNRLAEDASGSIDVDTGDVAMTLDLLTRYYNGDATTRPCPYCANDPVPGDGMREGTCVLGANAGLACDADATNTSFPAPGGGGHSLDCFPDPGKNISGAGLLQSLTLTTGSTSLTAGVDCTSFGVPATCHCGICSGNQSLGCRSDEDCAPAAAGTCMKRANFDPKENGCTDTAACTSTGDGDATCNGGPTDRYCDGVLRADGQGFLACLTNADCDAGTIGIEGGNCTLSKTRKCFLPTIEAQGAPDPDMPIGSAIFCVPPTSTAGRNALWGLPGPARIVSQLRTRKLCGGPEGRAYAVNGGCVAPPAAPCGLRNLHTSVVLHLGA